MTRMIESDTIEVAIGGRIIESDAGAYTEREFKAWLAKRADAKKQAAKDRQARDALRRGPAHKKGLRRDR